MAATTKIESFFGIVSTKASGQSARPRIPGMKTELRTLNISSWHDDCKMKLPPSMTSSNSSATNRRS